MRSWRGFGAAFIAGARVHEGMCAPRPWRSSGASIGRKRRWADAEDADVELQELAGIMGDAGWRGNGHGWLQGGG